MNDPRTIRARRDWTCEHCGQEISKGSMCVEDRQYSGHGAPPQPHYHLECVARIESLRSAITAAELERDLYPGWNPAKALALVDLKDEWTRLTGRDWRGV